MQELLSFYDIFVTFCHNLYQVLYLKNLSPRVKERDLISLFARFQEKKGPPIQFQIMTGRMRGQAFITFPSKQLHLDNHSNAPSVCVRLTYYLAELDIALAHGRGPVRKINFQYSQILLALLPSSSLSILHNFTPVSSISQLLTFPFYPTNIYFLYIDSTISTL